MARASKTKPTAKKQTGKITYGKLRRYNFIAAALLVLQAVAILVLSNSQKGVVPVSANFVTKDNVASSAAGHSVFSIATQHLFDVHLAYAVTTFLLIGALAHLLAATWKRKVYESDLAKGVNRSRWIEYIFSAGTMIVAIALLAGILDFASLAMVFALMAITSLLGLNMELRNQKEKRVDWASYYIGIVAAVVPWAVMLFYVWNSHVYGSGVPGFVYWIYFSLIALFASFALNMYFQYKKLGHWSNYLYGERAYIIMSLIVKTALAWQIFFGALR